MNGVSSRSNGEELDARKSLAQLHLDVTCGSKCEVAPACSDVRFSLNSDQKVKVAGTSQKGQQQTLASFKKPRRRLQVASWDIEPTALSGFQIIPNSNLVVCDTASQPACPPMSADTRSLHKKCFLLFAAHNPVAPRASPRRPSSHSPVEVVQKAYSTRFEV